MDNQIRLIKHEHQLATAIDPNRFELNQRGRWPWLQKLLFKLLRKLGANSLNTSVSYKTVEIDTKSILNALMENQRDVMTLYNKRARYIVMGPRDYARFTNDPECRDLLYFGFSVPIGMGNRRTIMGMEVVIVPWIEGFFVMPDLQDERMVRAG